MARPKGTEMIAHTTNQRPGINHGQPTLSQQIRRLEEIIGTPLLQRRREGLRLTPAGSVLLDTSRTVLSLVDHGVNRTRQAAGLGRPCLRVVLPPQLPDALAVQAAAELTATAAVVWNGDLPRPLQQILFDAADGTTSPDAVGTGEHEPAAVSQ